MIRRTTARAAGTLALIVAVSSACTSAGTSARTSASGSSSATGTAACTQASAALVAAVQHYVDAYGTPVSSGRPGAPPAVDGTQLQNAVGAAQQAVRDGRCSLDQFRQNLDTGLSGVTARGPLAKAVLDKLSASLTGTAKQTPETVSLTPSDDLAKRIAELAAGSTVQLAAGVYSLTDPLVLLEGITLRGAGRDATTIQTAAADTGVLVLTDGRVELRDVTVAARGPAPLDLVVGGPSSSLVLTAFRARGAVSSPAGFGNGVVMTSSADAKARGTTLEVTDSSFENNQAAGVLLTAGHAGSIRTSTFVQNATCGVCFAGSSTGAVRDSSFQANAVGIAVSDQAKPALANDSFNGGQFGIQVSNTAAPVITAAAVSGASRGAMIFADQASGKVDGASCTNVPYGIVVGPNALPLLGQNSCLLAKGA